MNNKATPEPAYISISCRTYMNNKIRAKRTSDAQDEQVSAKRTAPENVSSLSQSTKENFYFKKQCFNCTKVCEYDDKHSDRNKFEYVLTMDFSILKATLKICQQWNEKYSKVIEMGLLRESDLIAAETKYHKVCRSSFENSPLSCLTPGLPTSEEKMSVFFLSMCCNFEDEMEIYALT